MNKIFIRKEVYGMLVFSPTDNCFYQILNYGLNLKGQAYNIEILKVRDFLNSINSLNN